MISVGGIEYEHRADAAAGITLTDGARWWGSRIQYRRIGIADRRWTRFTLVDAHPFDYDTIAAAVREHVLRGKVSP